MKDAVIRTEGLTKQYGGHKAVDDLTLEIPRGGVVGFIGHNGAGKTTTIRMLLGLIQPTSGKAYVLGQPIHRPIRYLHRVGALIESPAFHPALSARKNLLAFAHLGGHEADRIPKLLEQVGLASRADDPYKSFSLGMKQRLGIANALLADPELLILDEPTNGLDPAGIREMREFLRSLADEGKTVFVSSHLLSEIQRMCDHLVVLRRGKLVFAGPMDELNRRFGGIVARTTNPKENAVILDVAKAAGYEAVEEEDRVRVLAPPTYAAELNRRLSQRGVWLSELAERSPDLEHAVLEITEGEGGA